LARGGSLMVVMTVDGLLLCHGHLSLQRWLYVICQRRRLQYIRLQCSFLRKQPVDRIPHYQKGGTWNLYNRFHFLTTAQC
jgi:hypothetical protein